ncbi:multidrug and toxin extrusion protein 1-like isoform X1 [Ranitomeya imitator]|uniref:multidrug and toxin extrusion protein 1-like isoform X1 n=1 Tax=Ranitomeya imitator TaxID=111125 RepID=UPI0037E906FB
MPRGCCTLILHRIREIYHENVHEFRILLWYTGPLVFINLLDYVPLIITCIFVGHIGKVELDAMMLAISFTTVTGVAVGFGLTTACDTLLSQIYGGRNLKYMGVIIQRAILILSLACFPCLALYINTENIMLLFGQNKEVARQTELCVLILIPTLPAFFLFQLKLRYLQNQEIIWPQIVVSCLSCLLIALLNYLLLFVLKIGVKGAALAITISSIFECLLLFSYILVRKLHLATWAGWSVECLKDWGPFLELGMPGIVIQSLKVWTFEIVMILSGLINLVELGGQSILFQLITVLHKIPFALELSTSIRVGFHLGAGMTGEAKKSAKLSIFISGIVAVLSSILMIALRGQLGKIFTNEKDILTCVYRTMPMCALFYFFNPSVNGFLGVLKGIGKPGIGALAFFFGYCLAAFPIGVPLMFPAKFGIKGFWIGMTIAFVCINIYFFIYFWRIDWNLMTEKAKERIGLKKDPVAFFESHIDTPDNMELKNYASMDSYSTETEPLETLQKPVSKKLIMCRAFQAIGAISTFFIGLIIKLTVKQH